MKKKYRIDSIQQKREACIAIWKLPLDVIHQVLIALAEITRTVAQNRLYWKWITLIADELGWSKDDAHYHFKKTFLVRIFTRDDTEYAAMIQAVRDVYKTGLKIEAESMHKGIVKLTSTTRASTKQFTEYLKDIEMDAELMKIRLPHPDEYWRAMGIRKAA